MSETQELIKKIQSNNKEIAESQPKANIVYAIKKGGNHDKNG